MLDKALAFFGNHPPNREVKILITACPCCGHKFTGNMFEGCPSCHAQAVGEPLARPERQLPNYSRAFFLSALGSLLLLSFLVAGGLAWFSQPVRSFKFWNLMAAGETASWQLRYVALPLALLGLGLGVPAIRRIRDDKRFAGLKLAYGGLALTAVMALMMGNLIGITVPERLRQRQVALDAGLQVTGRTIDRALVEYRVRYGTLPAGLEDLGRLPDADGSIARAVAQMPADSYRPWSVQADAKGSKTLNGARVRPASARLGNASVTEGLSFTNYELRLPGQDQKLSTDDDWMMRDGVMQRTAAWPVTRSTHSK